jgi:hypothetical protein
MKRSQNLRRLAAIKATGEEDIQSSGDLAVLDGAGTFRMLLQIHARTIG